MSREKIKTSPAERAIDRIEAKLEIQRLQDIEKAIAEINEQIDDPREHSHHVVGWILRGIATKWGKAQANRIIEDLDLEYIFGIAQVKENK